MIEKIPVIKHIIELLSAIWSLIGKLFGAKVKSEAQIDIPKKTIIVTPTPGPFNTWWHMGSYSGSPAMQVVGYFKVTNITKYNIFLSAAEMKKPKLLGHATVMDSKSRFNEIPHTAVADPCFTFLLCLLAKKRARHLQLT